MFDFPFSGKFKNKRIKTRFSEDIEPQEILLDRLAQKKEDEIGISEKKLEVPLPKALLGGIFVVFFIIVLLFFSETFYLQIINGQDFVKLAEQNKFLVRSIEANRGIIYDKDLNPLVFNLPSFDLVLNKNFLPESNVEKEKVLSQISQIINVDLKELENNISQNQDSEMVVARDVDHQASIVLEARIEEFPGFSIGQTSVRNYVDGPTFAHLIGYTGKINSEELKKSSDIYSITDYIGRNGVEKSYENLLRKNPGKLQIERDALGNVISKEVVSQPESGKSLVLWVDSGLQKKIEEELNNKLKEVGAKKAVGVALDPKTGGILALVSLPSFDNNLFQKGADQSALNNLLKDTSNTLFNQAISGKYLVGSTIKPLIASAALQENIISPTKKINDNLGYISIPNSSDPSAPPTIKRDWAIHGPTDMRKAIAESCDVYFYTIGGGFGDQQGLGPTKMKKYLDLFGWGDKTGIDLPNEVAGFVPDKDWKKETFGESWRDGDTYNMSIGQGFLGISPIEVATAFSAIANGGTLYQPQAVKEIIDNSSGSIKVEEEIKPKIIRQNFIDPQNLQIVREGMRQAVTGANSPQASSTLLNSLSVAVAAKTGTAELGNNYYNNWISIFAPYDNPQIVLMLLIGNVKGTQAAVLPVAKNILEWYFNNGK